MKTITSSLLLSIVLICIGCQVSPKQESEQLGVLNHSFVIDQAAQPAFEKGLLLLHSFEYDDAKEAFQEASTQDSTELMAYWGEAMSHYKALWRLQDIDSGRAVMQKAGSNTEHRLEMADTELEKDFWMGVEILYGDGELYTRNKDYAKHMAQLYEKYPGNQEVAAFYALGLMWTVEEGRDPEVFDLSAEIAKGILDENPQHPGALHYLIHANDDPAYAYRSITAANEYGQLAPDATHALHMPSHIYLALGMWNEEVASNEASYAASVKRMERKGLDDKARGYHSYAWLHYGYLQQGRFEDARQLLADMQTYTQNADTRAAKSYLIIMQNAQRVESGQWPDSLEPMYIDADDLSIYSQVAQHFNQALMAFDHKDTVHIQSIIDTVETKIAAAQLIAVDEGISVCGAGPTRYKPSHAHIVRAQVMTQEIKAMIHVLKQQDDLAELYLRSATQTEDESEYSYGPPDISYPSYELYGEWLLSQNRAKEALVQFDRSLAIAPNRTRALKGKIHALKQLDQLDEVKKIEAILSDFYQNTQAS
ncbi:hypothetical protein N6H18_14255 [Reichenbachiella agarivorans]|uniref:Tetratricopeptide repeat-containing protein n=1 Tax=Reichenbachiella agarivorans TaxID=2979464 RepID=A0ABY6CLX9_9BACT|nr:hypothetical protein [Reichenbachiella agarivorans]UXP31511.1 hypothetical protein N6H18_14255 [Reichenbachiella agarivorans]